MLAHLYIQNYALIRELDIHFADGFSVITGETGAGKSIILGALGLIMGNRADSASISSGAQKCIIEASFGTKDEGQRTKNTLQTWFKENDLDYEEECVIRREINVSGKSRAFINDTPVTLALLKELGNQLIDIHSQHENLLLQDDAFQLALVDSMADNAEVRSAYSQAYHAYKAAQKQLQALQEQATKATQDADYIAFQVRQLQDAKIQQGEDVQLEAEYNLLTHAEEIRTQLALATGYLAEEDKALSAVREARASMQKIGAYLPAEDNLVERLDSLYIELKDIADTVENLAEKTDYDPERQQIVEERLDLINTLLQKHRLHTTDELLGLQADMEQQLAQIESFDEDLAALQKQVESCRLNLVKKAEVLTASRKQIVPAIEAHLTKELTQLGMPNAKIRLAIESARITDTPIFRNSDIQKNVVNFTPSGADNVQLLFSANKNGTLRNVAEVASGGEIARLMLCIKALLAQKQSLPTLIFDEIDTGVSGDIAARMGRIMQTMGQQMQVISITHLPQIAALGNNHYKVYKADREDHTETHITHLTQEQRIQEIAQMLSGSHITDAAIQNAQALLANTL